MALADLLQQDAIVPALKVTSKKQLLQELAVKAAKLTGVPEREIFDVILQRERLGSTGVGHGIAIPHGKLSSISSIKGVFARLESPIDFEALDDEPVDLVFLLLAPEGAGADHLADLDAPRQHQPGGGGANVEPADAGAGRAILRLGHLNAGRGGVARGAPAVDIGLGHETAGDQRFGAVQLVLRQHGIGPSDLDRGGQLGSFLRLH